MTRGGRIEYRGARYSAAEFERQFDPRAIIENVEAIQARREKLSDEARERLTYRLGLPYGERPRETLDIYPASQADAPVLVFLHGGYWRAGSARANGFIAEPFVAAGACVIALNTDLCPAVGLGEIVSQVGRALAWIADHAGEYGGDPDRLHLLGHSAGAHLAAMALADESGTVPIEAIKGVSLISGIYDLEPVLWILVNAVIGLRPEDVEPLSPLLHAPAGEAPIFVAVGLGESPEWIRQSRLYAEFCHGAGKQVTHMEVEDVDHYSILLEMRNSANPLTDAVCRQMGLSAERPHCD